MGHDIEGRSTGAGGRRSGAGRLISRRGVGHHAQMRIGPARLAFVAVILVVASGALGVTIGFAVADDGPGGRSVAARQLAPATADSGGAGADGPVPASSTPPASVPPSDQPSGSTPDATATPESAADDPSAPTAVAVATDPARLVVPAIEVDAPVIPLGLNPDQTLEVPTTASDTGWWTGGSAPGAGGPAVIAGHVNLRSEPGVFVDLDKLQAGDTIEVIGDDLVVVAFVVDRVERHPKDSFPTDRVYGPTEGSELRLITCGGAFDEGTGHYVDNIIAFARRAPAPA